MKKVFCMLLLIVVASFSATQAVYANTEEQSNDTVQLLSKEILSTNYLVNDGDKIVEVIEDPVFYDETIDEVTSKTDYIEPNYIDPVVDSSSINEGFDLPFPDVTPMGTWWAYPDSYESNNSFSSANDMTEGNPSSIYSYSLSFSANIHKEPWFAGGATDQDYYRVDVFADAQLRVELTNVPSHVDYDLELYMFKDVRYPQWSDVERVMQSAGGGNGQNELIIRNVKPGTYFVRVYPYQSDDWDEDNYYRLSISKTLNSRTNVSIAALKSAGAKAAIWQSDFDPFGMSSFDFDGRLEVGFRAMLDYYYMDFYQNPFHHKLKSYATNDEVINTIVYVWDVQWRIQIYDLLWEMAQILENEVSNNQQIILTFEYIAGAIKVVGTILGAIPQTKILGTILTGGTSAASYLAPVLFPEIWNSNKESILNYIYVLLAAFEADHNTSPNEVVHIKLRYKYSSHTHFLINQTDFYIELVTEYSLTNFLYSQASIAPNQSGSYSRGNVYAIRNYSDFTKFRNGTLTPGVPSTGGGGGGGGRDPIELLPYFIPPTDPQDYPLE